MDPIKVDFSKKGTGGQKEIVIPPEKAALKTIISLVLTVVTAFVAFYFMIPAINFKSYDFYLYIGVVAASYVVFQALLTKALSKPEYTPYVKKRARIPGIIIGVLVVVCVVGWLVGCQLFRAKAYSKVISSIDGEVQTGDGETFNDSDAIWEYKFDDKENGISSEAISNIPKIDEDAATKLANKALSELSDANLVSQFVLSSDNTQINYKGEPVRVFALEYSNIIKWLTNSSNGLPGYVTVNMATEDYTYVSLGENTIKYSPAEYLNHYLLRHLRFEYPTYMFGDETFEIDEEGNPYWIVPILDKTIGLFAGTDIKGVIICEADGTTHEYSIEEIRNGESADGDDLTWIDRAYTADLIVEQFDNFGKFNKGFFNSFLGQKQTYVSSDGYSFLAMDDDVWLYTGVTSVTSDESLTGFVLVNQRTKEVRYYNVPGSTETAAQTTAQGKVQEKGYTATFPLLINVQGEPTYFIALKDASSVVQQYALVNVVDYNTIIEVKDKSNIAELRTAYEEALIKAEKIKKSDIEEVVETDDSQDAESAEKKTENNTKPGTITDIRTAVIDGESCYYIKLDSSECYYKIFASDDENVVILNKGDSVTVTFSGEGDIVKADSIELN